MYFKVLKIVRKKVEFSSKLSLLPFIQCVTFKVMLITSYRANDAKVHIIKLQARAVIPDRL